MLCLRGSFSLQFCVTTSKAHNFRHIKANQVIPKPKMKLILCRILIYNLVFIPKFLMHAISPQQLQTSTKFINLIEMRGGSFKILNHSSSSQKFFLDKESNINIITKHYALVLQKRLKHKKYHQVISSNASSNSASHLF